LKEMTNINPQDQPGQQSPPEKVQRGRGAPKGNQNRVDHGLVSLKKAWSKLGNRTIDGRSPAAVQLRKWRTSIIEDLGGEDAVSTQQEAIVDLAVKSKLLLDSIDAWLFTQPSLVNARKRALLPVVVQRQSLADGFAKYMSMLGLERRHKVKSLNEILAQPESEPKPQTNGATVHDEKANGEG